MLALNTFDRTKFPASPTLAPLTISLLLTLPLLRSNRFVLAVQWYMAQVSLQNITKLNATNPIFLHHIACCFVPPPPCHFPLVKQVLLPFCYQQVYYRLFSKWVAALSCGKRTGKHWGGNTAVPAAATTTCRNYEDKHRKHRKKGDTIHNNVCKCNNNKKNESWNAKTASKSTKYAFFFE